MKQAFLTVLMLALTLSASAPAHPGSGIVVDRNGNVYFVDTGSGVYKIDRNGKLTKLPGPAYHWMAIDSDGRLANAKLPNFSRGGAVVERAGSLIMASDFPVTVSPDGRLVYPWLSDDDRLQIFRLTSEGKTTVVKTLNGTLKWLNGIAAGPDGSVYYTENKAVRRISPQGELTTVADNITLADCDPLPGVPDDHRPYLRGLDVDSSGTVYAAVNGCRAVVKITPDGKIKTILRAEIPWSPTGVAVYGKDLYVLEYIHTETDDRRDWAPRVRRILEDGRVEIVAAVER